MRIGIRAVAVALVLAMAWPAAAKDVTPLAPATPWTLDYDTDSCALRRLFGEGKERAYLEFRRFSPNLVLQTTIGASKLRRTRASTFKYQFGRDAEWRDVRGGIDVSLGDEFHGVLFSPEFVELPGYDAMENPLEKAAYLRSVDWRAVEAEAAARIDTITLRGSFQKDLSLALGPLDKPIEALNVCIDDLVSRWGIDVEAHKTLTRPATPIDMADSSSMIGYPPKMARQFMPGLVNIRLDIDDKGKVTACHIQMPLSDPEFAKSSCADIQHAFEFEPALDKDGKPIASYWVTRVQFQIGQ